VLASVCPVKLLIYCGVTSHLSLMGAGPGGFIYHLSGWH